MTTVYLAPWLFVMSAASWLGDWTFGAHTDHPEFLAFLGLFFGLYDGFVFVVRLLLNRQRGAQ